MLKLLKSVGGVFQKDGSISVVAITAEEIAQRVGCSPATVSRVVNGSGPVSPRTQEAVLKAIREGGPLHRRRGRAAEGASRASTAVTMQTGMIEIVMHLTASIEHMEIVNGRIALGPIAHCPPDRFFKPDNRYTNTTFRRIIDGAMDESTRWRHRPVLRTTSSLTDRQLQVDLARPDTLGLIILGNDGPGVDAFLRRCPCPHVSMIGMGRNGWPCSTTDDLPGMRQAVSHLVELGHRRIGYVACEAEVPAFAQRHSAFAVAMVEAGLSIRGEWIYRESTHVADISRGVEAVLANPDRPTAYICCYDGAAFGVMQAAARQNLSVPHDLSVIGFGNQDIAELIQPSLTTIHAPTYEMGRTAVKLLMLQRMQPETAGEGLCVRLPTHLVERMSTGPAPVDPTNQSNVN